jgi:hypothetical protein
MLLVLVLFSETSNIKQKLLFSDSISGHQFASFGGFYGPAVSVSNMPAKILQKPFLDMASHKGIAQFATNIKLAEFSRNSRILSNFPTKSRTFKATNQSNLENLSMRFIRRNQCDTS